MTLPDPPNSTQQVIAPPPELPGTPRPDSPQVKSMATWEPRPRFWFVMTLFFLVVAGYFLVTRVAAWSSDRALVTSGTPVAARLVWANGSDVRNSRKPWDSPVRLEYDVNGQTVQLVGRFEERKEGDTITIGEAYGVRVDPQNPTRWSDRTQPVGIWQSLVAVYVLFPVAVMSVLGGLIQRARLLGTWRHGKLVAAAVTSASSSPIAPGYTLVNAAPAGGTSVRVYVPRSLEIPHRGDVIWLLVRDNGPALAARVFL